MLVLCHTADLGTLAEMGTPTGGAAWQLLDSAQWPTATGAGMKLWWKIAGSSEPSTYGLTQNSGADGTATIVCVQSPGAGTPVVAHTGGTTLASSIPTPSTTPNGATDFEIRFVGATSGNGSATTFTPPGGFTERSDVTSGTQYAPQSCATRTLSSSGATGTQNFTSTNTLASYLGFTVNIGSAGGGGGTQVQPSVRSVSTASGNLVASYTVAKPAGTQPGDLMFWAQSFTAAGSNPGNNGPQEGEFWAFFAHNSDIPNTMSVWWKIAGPSEPATYTVGNFSTTERSSVVLITVKDAPTDYSGYPFQRPPNVTNETTSGGSNLGSIVSPSFTPPDGLTLDLRIVTCDGSASARTWTPPAGYTEVADIHDAGNRTGVTVAWKQLSGTAPTGTQTFTASSATMNSVWTAAIGIPAAPVLIALNDAGSAVESLSVVQATQKTLTDTGSSTETLSAVTTAALADAGSAVEQLTVTATSALADTATAAEMLTAAATVALAETGSAADAINAGMPVALAQAGTAADALTVQATVTLTQAGTAVDALTVTVQVALSDTASAADALIGVLIEDITVTAGAAQRGWSSGEPASSFTAGMPVRGWCAGPPTT